MPRGLKCLHNIGWFRHLPRLKLCLSGGATCWPGAVSVLIARLQIGVKLIRVDPGGRWDAIGGNRWKGVLAFRKVGP